MSECIPASVRFLENVAAERQIPEKYPAEIERPYPEDCPRTERYHAGI